MKLDADGARRGIEEKIAGPLRWSGRRRAGYRRDRHRQDVARRARGVGGEGLRSPRLRAGGLGRRGPLARRAIARELHIPKVVVPLFPSHFSALGMLLADERHDFIRTFYCDLASVDFATPEDPPRDGGGGRREPASCRGRGPHPSRPALCRAGVHAAGAGERRADRGRRSCGISAAFDALYEHRYAHSPDEPVEMVNIRLAMIGKRPQQFSAPGGHRVRVAHLREVYFADAGSRSLPGLPARGARRRQRHRRPALIQEHGTTTVLFERTPDGRALGRADHHGGRRATNDTLDPVTLEVIRNALPASPTRWRPTAAHSYNMMIYECATSAPRWSTPTAS